MVTPFPRTTKIDDTRRNGRDSCFVVKDMGGGASPQSRPQAALHKTVMGATLPSQVVPKMRSWDQQGQLSSGNVHPRPTELETLGVRPRNLPFKEPSTCFRYIIKFEKHWPSLCIDFNSGKDYLKEEKRLSEEYRAGQVPYEIRASQAW